MTVGLDTEDVERMVKGLLAERKVMQERIRKIEEILLDLSKKRPDVKICWE